MKPGQSKFLSTLSLRRATVCVCCRQQSRRHFYPRSPCGERLQRQIEFERYSDISIHALLAESDLMWPWSQLNNDLFLSTLSLRRATEYWVGGYGTANNFYPRSPCGERLGAPVDRMPSSSISIHALLAESDHETTLYRVVETQFLSTLSLRRATTHPVTILVCEIFLSTLSLRRATLMWYQCNTVVKISIHALLAESDQSRGSVSMPRYNFYPRSPCGERHQPQKRHLLA